MKRLSIIAIAVACVLGSLMARGSEERGREVERAPRFEAVDVYVDSGDVPLAAYQFELKARGADVKIVGIEGGDDAAFAGPPYYDPAALMHGRVIIAAFSTDRDLPSGRVCVARVHVRVGGAGVPRYEVKLQVAASAGGERIAATAAVGQGESK
jgi:hypothetical protein